MSSAETIPHKKQPSELWELALCFGLFSFGQGMFFTFLVAYIQGQLGESTHDSLLLFSAFISLYFTLPLLGGYLAERYGYRLAVTIGLIGCLLSLFIIAYPTDGAFRLGAALFAVGSGFVVPALYCLLGNAYVVKDSRREGGFTFMYLTSNFGMFIAGSAGALIAVAWSYQALFLITSGFLLLALCWFVYSEYVTRQGVERQRFISTVRTSSSIAVLVVATIIATIVCVVLFKYPNICNILIAVLFVICCMHILTIVKKEMEKLTRLKLLVFLILSIISIFFWSLYMLEPSLLTVYVEKQVNLVVMGFSVPAASVFSLDSLFIVILGLTFSQVWPYLARRKINPTLPVKFASSFLFIGFGYLLLAFLIKTTGHDTRFSVLWFLPIYFLFTMGELMIGPIGFSMVGRLAPPGREGYLMGVWQLCIGVAGAGSIIIDLFANVPEHAGLASANVIYQSLFFKLSIISFAVCAVVFLFAPKLKKLLGVSD